MQTCDYDRVSLGDDIMRTTDTIKMLDTYKFVRRRRTSAYNAEPSEDIRNRILFIGAGYAFAALMESAFAKFAASNNDDAELSIILFDEYFSDAPISPEDAVKKYGMKMCGYTAKKELAVKAYGMVLDECIDELAHSLYKRGVLDAEDGM